MMFEIFPWHKQLETDIAEIDAQHRILVNLLNRLGQQHVQGASEAEIHAILAELADYANYHFQTEEGVWQTALAGDSWFEDHVNSHRRFFEHIVELQSGNRPFRAVLDDLFAYLTQWLAFHILDSDKRMALAVKGVSDGLSLEAARQRADAEMRGASAVLIQTVLSMYQTVSAQALELMHEKLARQRAETALLDGKQRWRFFLDDDDAEHTPGTALEQRLRVVVDHVPAGVVVVDARTQRFVFANSWFSQMLGYSLDELLDMTPQHIHPAQVMPQVEQDIQSMKVGEEQVSLAIPTLRKDGSCFTANIERVPIELDGQLSVLAVFTDVTARLKAEQALQTSESHLHTLINTIPDLVWLKNTEGVYLSCNRAFERFFGAKEADIVGKTDHDFVARELADFFRQKDQAAMAAQRPVVNEEWITFADNGQRALMETTKVPMLDPQGQLQGVLGIGHDITERRTHAEALEAERLRLQNAVDAAQAGTWEWDVLDDQVRFSERAAAMLGYSANDFRQGTYEQFFSLLHPDDQAREQELMTRHFSGELPRFEAELRLRHRDGHWVWWRTLGRVMQRTAAGEPTLVAGIGIDISDQKTHREQLDYLTHHDALTGLPNRKLFVDLLAASMAATSAQHHLAVAYIDLDGFAAFNQDHGEEVGNQLIVAVSRRLALAMREHQQLAHIGGDEFAVILSDLAEPQAVIEPIEHLLTVVSQPLSVHGLNLAMTASIGVTLFPQHDKVDAEQLLRQADQAMYLAKLAGKNRYHLFDPVNDESTRARLMRIDEVRHALGNNEFVLFYQPKVHLRSGEVVGFEALIRWQHPERGLLPPVVFIPLLDQHPLAITLGDWVIETALAQLAQWKAQGLHTTVSVNIDAQQLLDPDFADRLQQQLGQFPMVLPAQLELEILETGALENMTQVSALIARLQAMGLSCALDDFGTGYSSLTFLKQLTAHTIKIDQSFVRGMLDDAGHAAIVNSVLGLARNFDRRALAEGIETEAHGCSLIEFGCDYGQGYFIARPMPAAEVAHWLAHWQAPESWVHCEAVAPRDIPVLLAEVEHRAWCRQVHDAYVTRQISKAPGNDDVTCRFGLWLNKPTTRQRFGRRPLFAHLEQTHHAIHQLAAQLLDSVRHHTLIDADSSLAELEALSQIMLDELRQLRHDDVTPESEWMHSGLSER